MIVNKKNALSVLPEWFKPQYPEIPLCNESSRLFDLKKEKKEPSVCSFLKNLFIIKSATVRGATEVKKLQACHSIISLCDASTY